MPLTKTLRQLASISGGDARFRELCEQLPVGVFVIDVRDYCTYANAAARAILGIEPDQTLGETWAHYLHPDDAAEAARQWQLAVERQTELVNESRCQLPARGARV